MSLSRRTFLGGLAAAVAAPAIVRATSLEMTLVRHEPIILGVDIGAGDFTTGLLVKATERWAGVYVDPQVAAVYGGPSWWFPEETYFEALDNWREDNRY